MKCPCSEVLILLSSDFFFLIDTDVRVARSICTLSRFNRFSSLLDWLFWLFLLSLLAWRARLVVSPQFNRSIQTGCFSSTQPKNWLFLLNSTEKLSVSPQLTRKTGWSFTVNTFSTLMVVHFHFRHLRFPQQIPEILLLPPTPPALVSSIFSLLAGSATSQERTHRAFESERPGTTRKRANTKNKRRKFRRRTTRMLPTTTPAASPRSLAQKLVTGLK